MKTPYLSIIVPVFNEKERIGKLKTIDDYLAKQSFSSEIIIVNDGSTDNTLQILRTFNLKTSHKVISYRKNKGKGHAIKKGVLKAGGEYRLFTDIDLSTPIEELKIVIKKFKEGHDVVIGSRKRKGAKLTKRQPFLRELLGKGFTALSRNTLGVNVSDFTCGFKGFSKKAAEEIFKRQKIERWGFDSEILFIASKLGFNIKEVPVRWKDNSATRVRLPYDILSSLKDLIKIKSNWWMNKYNIEKYSSGVRIYLLFLSTILFLGLVVFWPSFSLAHSGDDWLAFFRFKYHVGEWSNGNFNTLTYLLTPYGAQDINMGLLSKIFGYNSPTSYYVISFIFRMLAALGIFYVVKKVTKSSFSGFISALFFAVTTIGIGATDWVFNMPSYLALFIIVFFIYFFIKHQLEYKIKYLVYSGLLYYLAFVTAPIRAHGLPILVVVLDIFHFLKDRKHASLKRIATRQLTIMSIFFFIRFTGQSMGQASDSLQKLGSGINYMINNILQSNYGFLVHPLIVVGRFFTPENLLTTGGYTVSLVLGVLFVLLFLLVVQKARNGLAYYTFAAFSWTLVSFAFPYIWNPHDLLGTTHRYLIMPALGLSIFLGLLIEISKEKKAKIIAIIFATLLIAVHARATNLFLSDLKEKRSKQVHQNIWSSFPKIEPLGKKSPLIFYFEGDSGVIYQNIAFGFPPHIAILYDIREQNKLPVPLEHWSDLVTAVTTGENMTAYGYPPQPVSLESVYSFIVKADGTLINTTSKKRHELKNIFDI